MILLRVTNQFPAVKRAQAASSVVFFFLLRVRVRLRHHEKGCAFFRAAVEGTKTPGMAAPFESNIWRQRGKIMNSETQKLKAAFFFFLCPSFLLW